MPDTTQDPAAVDLASLKSRFAGGFDAKQAPAGESARDGGAVFESVMRSFAGRMDVTHTVGPDDAPLLQAAGKDFAMLHGGALVVRLHPLRCAQRVDEGRGRLFVHEGQTYEDWLVVAGSDAAEWTAHTMEALAWAKE